MQISDPTPLYCPELSSQTRESAKRTIHTHITNKINSFSGKLKRCKNLFLIEYKGHSLFFFLHFNNALVMTSI